MKNANINADALEEALKSIVDVIGCLYEKQNEIIDKHNVLSTELLKANQRIEELERKVESLRFCEF